MIRTQPGLLLLFAGFFLIRCAAANPSPPEGQPKTGRSTYSGNASCVACHRQTSQNYEHTPHHLTSQLPTSTSVLGSFQEGNNSLTTVGPTQAAEPGLQFLMESKPDGFFETAQTGWGSKIYKRTERIDLVTGSGVRGQTYLFWQGSRLFELPVSYWRDGRRWINSPGYIDGTADFSRTVNPACLECHATYIRALSSDPNTNRYDRTSLEPGISCESCHGPGANHVRLETQKKTNSGDSSINGILNPARFSRDRQVDLCAECHNGIQRVGLKPTFSFIPGSPLSEYFKALPSPDSEHPDVHGNQVGLLQRSKCYRSSEKMSCSTCHDVHTSVRSAESYSQKCLGCHSWQSCGIAKRMGHQITNQCIECHMPVEETNVIVSQTAGQVVHAKMRNHWIKIYSARTGAKPK
jgi:Cytochrome c554 and c-prime